MTGLVKHHHKILIVLILVFAFGLRFFNVTTSPPSLYWEEVALGYDAFSILKTGKDHHGNFLPVVAFESFGDWKPSLYFYAIIPFIATLGLTDLAVRLPSILAGVVTVACIGLIARFVQKDQRNSNATQFVATTLAAISPWAILFSRAGWEVNLATSFVTVAVFAGFSAIKKKKSAFVFQTQFALLSSVLLSLAMYTYHGTRVIAPLVGLGLALYWLSHIHKEKNWIKKYLPKLILIASTALIILLPLLRSLQSPQVKQRFAETSIFSNLDIIEESNDRKEALGYSLPSKLLYHRYVLFGREIAENYFDHFRFDFLFLVGDQNPRHSTGFVGLFYHIDFIFFVFGIGWLVTDFDRKKALISFWLLISIVPAALTKTTPHALRILPAMPPALIILSFGVFHFTAALVTFLKSSQKHIHTILPASRNLKLSPSFMTIGVVMCISTVYVSEMSIFLRHYLTVYPKQYAIEWQYGYKEMVESVNSWRSRHDDTAKVYITREQGRPAMYYWFYSQTAPQDVQLEESVAEHDQGEFLRFQNITFVRSVNEVPVRPSTNQTLIVSSLDQYQNYQARAEEAGIVVTQLSTVQDLDGNSIWVLYSVESSLAISI